MNKMKNISLSLVLACYNEGPTFEKNVERIISYLDLLRIKYEIILVEDKSHDTTKETIEKLCVKHTHKCRALFHKKNKGRGATVTDGIKSARYKIVGFIDVDCEVSPVYIPDALRIISNQTADIVLGRRYYKMSVGSIVRSIVSGGYRRIASIILPTHGMDTESGYKFFNRKKILPILRYADHPGWFWDTQIVVLPLLNGLKVTEIPVLFIRRTDKKSTVNVFTDSFDYLVNIFRFKRTLRRKHLI